MQFHLTTVGDTCPIAQRCGSTATPAFYYFKLASITVEAAQPMVHYLSDVSVPELGPLPTAINSASKYLNW